MIEERPVLLQNLPFSINLFWTLQTSSRNHRSTHQFRSLLQNLAVPMTKQRKILTASQTRKQRTAKRAARTKVRRFFDAVDAFTECNVTRPSPTEPRQQTKRRPGRARLEMAQTTARPVRHRAARPLRPATPRAPTAPPRAARVHGAAHTWCAHAAGGTHGAVRTGCKIGGGLRESVSWEGVSSL